MLHTIGVHQSLGAMGLLLMSCAALGGAYLWAVWMGAIQFGAVMSPLASYMSLTMR